MERLAAQGYSRFTMREYESIADRFCAAIEKRALSSGDLDAATTERLRQAVLKEIPEYVRTWRKFCLGRFIEHLSEAGVATVPEPPAKKATALDRLREEYEAYLRRQRGLAESTIAHCTRFLERFVAFRFGEKLGDLNAITPDDIVAFLCKLKAGSKPRRYKALPSHLRSLFKFLFWSGKTRRNLADSLPHVATSADHLPLSQARTDQAADRGGSHRRRHRAAQLRDVAAHGAARTSRSRGCRDPTRRHRLAHGRDPHPRQGQAA
jgi:hypothetical protein